ncbi:hypothetical protein VIBNISFn27_790055 [Vibrio nigripulchritudo SFn27]|nr:hypothetical protein VIBNIBLFn1_820055 [Vibrio nigripulchritudo BLFn1]CCN90902.1 hypothetical protein VIBNISFn27_790055 [Vibrio nigripulchritudo SFn27]CCO41208.1 hypothetical protein VIBNISFn135_420020 [Vibrio nigripulchritudo SFn135]CCO54546.1 hypothetical protein VIBNIWn13_710020 [Vibrio nigripulchritudo Wn13]
MILLTINQHFHAKLSRKDNGNETVNFANIRLFKIAFSEPFGSR